MEIDERYFQESCFTGGRSGGEQQKPRDEPLGAEGNGARATCVALPPAVIMRSAAPVTDPPAATGRPDQSQHSPLTTNLPDWWNLG
ncbi:hypothetical protein E2C01_092538 [Portunus trituberculatus]|uniref:Uncharacterized protein n=1 Tax=Portunus trituberculatus TaxID=210409 RepID=A0A5B7JY08_PORTR|nr:hypothetical protein [Portunus trituberculatus]